MKPKRQYAEAVCTALLGLVLAECASAGPSVVGRVDHVVVSKPWGGVLLMLNSTTPYEATCGATTAWFPVDDPLYKSWLAMLITAKAAQKNVSVGTGGCEAVPSLATIPRVNVIELLD